MGCEGRRHRSPDHPREYGENKTMEVSTMNKMGSSPRIRGKCESQQKDPGRVGIIPANTGKIPDRFSPRRQTPDHPREYGENWGLSLSLIPGSGSSPRIRGKWPVVQASVPVRGIIPANTGKIQTQSFRTQILWDHPREYGENKDTAPSKVANAGSSPRIRGKCCD